MLFRSTKSPMSSPNTPTSHPQNLSENPFYSSAENDITYLGYTRAEVLERDNYYSTPPTPSFTPTYIPSPATKPPKKGGGGGSHWKPEEELAMCKAWLKIGSDGIVSNEQKGEVFYNRILGEMIKTYKVPDGRTGKAVKTHWNLIRNSVSSYVATLH